MSRSLGLLFVLLFLSLPLNAAVERCNGYTVDGARSSPMQGIIGVADFNGDGVPDIAGFSSVLFSGTTEVKLPGLEPVAAIVRLTRSGQPGLLRIAGTSLQSIRFSREGAISIQSTTLAGPSPLFLAVGDFNGDGIDDAVLREGIFFGNGDGTFTRGPALPMDIPVGFTATVAAGDFDGDHHVDLAIRPDWLTGTGPNFVYPSLTIYSGDGTGHFRTSRQVVDGFDLPIHVADVDGDGMDDLIINSWSGIDIVPSRPGAITQHLVTGGTAGYVEELVSGDFNGDGRPDIAAITQADSTSAATELRVWLSDENGVMKPAWRVSMRPAHLLAADMDGDGNDDIVISSWYVPEAAVIHSNGNGSFAGLRAIGAMAASTGVAGDFDGDGDDDLLLTDYTRTIVMWNDGNGSFHSTPLSLKLSGPVTAADIDGDGRAELLAPAGPGIVSVLRIAPNGSLTKLFDIFTDPAMYLTGIAVGRFSGGAPEVAIVEAALFGSPQGKVEVFDLRSPIVPRFTATLPPSLVFDVAASDINGDGLDDVIVLGEGLANGSPHEFGPSIRGYVSVLLSTGRFFEPLASLYQSPTAPLFAPVAGDFDGDGIGDVVFIGYNLNGTTGITVLYGDRQERSRSQRIEVALPYLPRLTATDLDGDGTDDILTATGSSSVLLFGSPAGIARREGYLARGFASTVFALRSRPGGVPLLLVPDDAQSPEALLFFPACGRSRAARH